MITTTLDAVDFVWSRLDESLLKTTIDGGIYKQKRPQDSRQEDVVVNSLPMVNLQLQECVLNVNIHVPNLVINSNGTQDSSQPNFSRLKELTALAASILTDVWTDDAQIHFDIQQQLFFEEEELNEHISSFRINFYSVNL